jgi:hypothetical protein
LPIPKAGTILTAKPLLLDECRENNKDPMPYQGLPTLEGGPDLVTGPLEVRHVEAPWGEFDAYSIIEWDIDPETIQPWHCEIEITQPPGVKPPDGKVTEAEAWYPFAQSQPVRPCKRPEFVCSPTAHSGWSAEVTPVRRDNEQ